MIRSIFVSLLIGLFLTSSAFAGKKDRIKRQHTRQVKKGKRKVKRIKKRVKRKNERLDDRISKRKKKGKDVSRLKKKKKKNNKKVKEKVFDQVCLGRIKDREGVLSNKKGIVKCCKMLKRRKIAKGVGLAAAGVAAGALTFGVGTAASTGTLVGQGVAAGVGSAIVTGATSTSAGFIASVAAGAASGALVGLKPKEIYQNLNCKEMLKKNRKRK